MLTKCLQHHQGCPETPKSADVICERPLISKDLILYSNFAPDTGIMVLPPLVWRHQRGVSSAYKMRLCLISTQSRLINDLAAADNKQGFTGEIN